MFSVIIEFPFIKYFYIFLKIFIERVLLFISLCMCAAHVCLLFNLIFFCLKKFKEMFKKCSSKKVSQNKAAELNYL